MHRVLLRFFNAWLHLPRSATTPSTLGYASDR
jgi:hypothetical protein